MQLEPAARLVAALRNTGRRRISLEELRAQFAKACPELAELADRRTRLSRIIRNAADVGDIFLPRRPQSWDNIGGAPLPGFVLLADRHEPRAPVVIASYAWHPLLAFVAHERNRLRLEAAKQVNEWLKSDPDLKLIVPIKERSLEIFGDEKRLDRLRTGETLFGQLTLADIGCRVCPLPLPFDPGPTTALGRPLLIVENNDTWASFSEWNRTRGRYAAIAYAGGGNAKSLAYDETFIDELLIRFKSTELLYFGDIDPAGLRIASKASLRRAARQTLPLMPETRLYAWLLDQGRRTPADKNERATAEDIAWLPRDLRGAVEELFAAGQRIPQEALGTRSLLHFEA